jgi:hypothetical protein
VLIILHTDHYDSGSASLRYNERFPRFGYTLYDCRCVLAKICDRNDIWYSYHLSYLQYYA